jgi:hypothetical protein
VANAKDDNFSVNAENGTWYCERCGQMIGEHQKSWMLKHGQWRAARPASQIAGFWINSLYSP